MRCCGKRGREVGLEEKQKFAGLDRLEKAFSVGGITLGAKAAAAAKSRQLCPTLCDPTDSSPPGSHPWDSPGNNTGVGCHCLLQLADF